jgi:hypothetical protein
MLTWPHVPKSTTPTTRIGTARIAGTPRSGMKAMWIIFTMAISTICTMITWTSMPSGSTPKILSNARLKSTAHTRTDQTADMKRCRMVTTSIIS